MVRYVKASSSNSSDVRVNLHNAPDNPVWVIGNVTIGGETYKVTAKVFLEGSQFGINKGPVSELYIAKDGKCIVNYARGWDTKPSEEYKEIYKTILNVVKDFRKSNPYDVD